MRRLLLIGILLAACSPQRPPDTPRNPPTLAAPTQFAEAQQPVTLNNVANAAYLGRLDQPDTSSTIFSFAVSPDATRLVGLNNDQMLSWNLLDGSLIFHTSRSDAIRVFYSPDKTEVYAVDLAGLTVVHDADTGGVKTSFAGNPQYSGSAAFSDDDGWLALGGMDGTVKVWDTYERQSLVTINAHSAEVSALAFSADGEALATAGIDGVVRTWRWRDRALIAETTLESPITIRRLAFDTTGRLLAVGTERDARLWTLDAPTNSYVLNTGRGGANQILMFSPDGRYLLAGNQAAGLSLWGLDSQQLAARLPDTNGDTLAAAFSPDGSLLLTAVLNGKVALWNLVQVTQETVNQANLPLGTERILNVDWTSDSRLLMFFDAGGAVYLWGIGD
ncbi:MAG: hypothetical protein IT319_17045 [Anaerolineae bacterium]|nr:hypothetical protein [Anaerolineae bacterium]